MSVLKHSEMRSTDAPTEFVIALGINANKTICEAASVQLEIKYKYLKIIKKGEEVDFYDDIITRIPVIPD